MITVRELIEILEAYDDNDIVILAKDGDGNNYSPLCETSQDVYEDDSSYSGQTYIRELTPGLREAGFTEEDLCHSEHKQNCITLWPIN